MGIINIAIDGPSGSGKSTAAKNLARELGIEYIDTGAMYRAVAYKVLRLGIEPDDESVTKMLADTEIDFTGGAIMLDGENVEGSIRTLEVSGMASEVSKLAGCRKKLVELQQKIGQSKSIVMDGRDIGTNVLPDADFKFFITCSIDVRAQRRYEELKLKGEEISLEEVKEDLSKRDYNDTHRALNPLTKAEDAIEISTDSIGIEEVTALLKDYCEK